MQGISIMNDPAGNPSILTVDLKHHAPDVDGVLSELLSILDRAQQQEEAERPSAERRDWLRLSAQGIERAYGDDEPEYTDADLKEHNPDYRPWKER